MKTKLTILLQIIFFLNIKVITDRPATTYIAPKPAPLTVVATMYNAVPSQCDNDPYITAGMYKINPLKASEYKWIALSRNLLSRWGGKFNYGDKVLVLNAGNKSGIYTIVDTMNKRYVNRIDFLETVGTRNYKFINVKLERANDLCEN